MTVINGDLKSEKYQKGEFKKMIIVDQSKCNIINFDKIINVGIEEKSTLTDETEISAQTNGYTIVLGKYKTEERAKEVLQEITRKYLDCNIEYCGMGYVKNKVYEMPEE